MTGGWQLLRNHPEKVMFGSQKDGFLTEEEYSSAMIVGITLEHSNYQHLPIKFSKKLCFLEGKINKNSAVEKSSDKD